MTHQGREAQTLAIIAGGAATGFGVLALAVAHRGTAGLDRALGPRLKAAGRHPVRRTAKAIAPVGKWWLYVPAAVGAAAWVIAAPAPRVLSERSRSRLAHQHRTGAGAIVASAVAAAALARVFDRLLPQPPTPAGHRSKRKPVFPSGHAFGPGAVSATAAYVLVREGLAPAGAAFPMALTIPVITAGGKLVEEKHWASDVLGGVLGAIAVSAACLAVYEGFRDG